MRITSHKTQNSNKEAEVIKCREELGVGASREEMLCWHRLHGFSTLHDNGEKTLKSHDEAAHSISWATDRIKGMKQEIQPLPYGILPLEKLHIYYCATAGKGHVF